MATRSSGSNTPTNTKRRQNPRHHRPACLTCAQRKVKCNSTTDSSSGCSWLMLTAPGDEALAICGNCQKKRRVCQHLDSVIWARRGIGGYENIRTQSSRLESDNALIDSTSRLAVPQSFSWIEEDIDVLYQQPTKTTTMDSNSSTTDLHTKAIMFNGPSSGVPESVLFSRIGYGALQSTEIVELLLYYIETLAPWYDLNDPSCAFANIVPLRALSNVILLEAIIAFAAGHKAKFNAHFEPIAEAFHSSCIANLIPLLSEPINSTLGGELLAATCLLRSYEILNVDSRKAQSHLFGAYTIASQKAIDLTSWSLDQAGLWNYLREDITVALECRRPIHLSLNGPIPEPLRGFRLNNAMMDASWCQVITYILAKSINLCFSQGSPHNAEYTAFRAHQVTELRHTLERWKAELPRSYEPISTAAKPGNQFPSLWVLRPWHAAGLQYYHTSAIILSFQGLHPGDECPQTVDCDKCRTARNQRLEHALHICGIASTNSSPAIIINSFGPLSYCGRFLVAPYQTSLINLLETCARRNGWNVTRTITDLQAHWAAC